jgi:hypothetical protein
MKKTERFWSRETVVLVLGCGALVVTGLAVIPTATLDHVGNKLQGLLELLLRDPSGTVGAFTILAGGVGAAVVAYRRARALPPGDSK